MEKSETLRSYIACFTKKKITTLNYNQDTTIRAFDKGLLLGSDLYVNLIKYKPRVMEKSLFGVSTSPMGGK